MTEVAGIVLRTWEGDGSGLLACSIVADKSDAGMLIIVFLTAETWSAAVLFAKVCKTESGDSSNMLCGAGQTRLSANGWNTVDDLQVYSEVFILFILQEGSS